MAIITPVFRYPDGREEPGPTFETFEHFGIGQTVEHDGIRWKAVEPRPVEDDPNRFTIVFDPDE